MPDEAAQSGTYGWVVDRAREILSDKDGATKRWREAELLRFADAGVARLRALRPAAQYFGLFRVVFRPVAPAGDGDAEGIATARAARIPADERWHEAIVHYVAYRALLMDEADAANMNLAQQHLKLFQEQCQT